MLHAGLDLSRKKLDVCLLSDDGEHLDQLAVPPDVDSLRTLARRIEEVHREPVCAVIESMTGARIVHDTLEACGWSVEIADAQKVKGLAPLACKTDKIDSMVLAVLSPPRPGAGDLAARSEGPGGARAGALSLASGQAQVGAQEPCPLDADQLRPRVPGHRPVRGRGPKVAGAARGARAVARQRHRLGLADRRPRASDRRAQPRLKDGHSDHPYIPLLMSAPGIGWVLAFTIAAEIGEIERFSSPEKLDRLHGALPAGQPVGRLRSPRAV